MIPAIHISAMRCAANNMRGIGSLIENLADCGGGVCGIDVFCGLLYGGGRVSSSGAVGVCISIMVRLA